MAANPESPSKRFFNSRVVNPSIIGLILAGLALVRIWSASFDDFTVYWRAGKEAVAGLSVYNETGHFQFKYSPFVALLLGLLYEALEKALLFLGFSEGGFRHHDLNVGPLIWGSARGVGNLFYWGWLMTWYLWFRHLSQESTRPALRSTHLSVLLLLLIHPLAQELGLGQVNAIPVLCLAWIVGQLDQNPATLGKKGLQIFWCSLALSLAIQFKLFSLIIFPLLAFRRKWSWMGGSILVTAICILGGLSAAHGWNHATHELQAWAVSLTQSSTTLMYSRFNVSWMGFVGKATGQPAFAKLSWAFLILSFLAIQFWHRHRDRKFQLPFQLAGILILNPLVWNYWLIFLAPMILQLLDRYADCVAEHPRLTALTGVVIWIPFLLMFALIAQNWLQPLLILGMPVAWLFTFWKEPAHA